MKRTTAPNNVANLYADDTGIGDGTLIIAEDKNLTQEELVNVAEMSGNSLNGVDDEQMKTAILETAGKLYTYAVNSTFTMQIYDKKPTILLNTGITVLTLAVAASVDEAQKVLIVNDTGVAVSIQGLVAANFDLNIGATLELYYDVSATIYKIIFPAILTGSTAPSVTPSFIGQRYIDTTADREYFAVGISASTDWRKVARYEYGTVTVVAGSGDVTVNFDFDWTNGFIFVCRSFAAVSYFDGGTLAVIVETTYDSLTNGSFTADHNMAHVVNPAGPHGSTIKTAALIGMPNAATPNSVTFDDTGVSDCYVKYVIIA